jgi:hypothetical protein
MINLVYTLQYKDIYDGEPEDIYSILNSMHPETMMRLVESKHSGQVGLINFFQNKEIQDRINVRLDKILKKFKNRVVLFNDLSYLRIIEAFLSVKDNLKNITISNDQIQENIFKLFLIFNQEIIGNEDKSVIKIKEMTTNDLESKAYFIFLNQFYRSDTELNKTKGDKLKYINGTIFKLKNLFLFLIEYNLEDFRNDIITSFNVKDENELFQKMINLLLFVLSKDQINSIIISEDDAEFINSIASQKVEITEDFRNLKENPLLEIGSNTFTYFDLLFLTDRFYKGIKFNFKKLYESDKKTLMNHGNFFSFYNLEFSEKYLTNKILNDIFQKKYFLKLSELITNDKPDYYIRHNNDIFIFECKDILINGEIKSSNDIEKIINEIKKKLLFDKKDVGVGQLVNHISKIIEKKFEFDEYVNIDKSSNLRIFPILILHERIFDIEGLNYILNMFFLARIKEKFGEKYDQSKIRNLTIIDIDTLIYLKDYFKSKDKNFKNLIEKHLLESSQKLKLDRVRDQFDVDSKLHSIFKPISKRKLLDTKFDPLKKIENLLIDIIKI